MPTKTQKIQMILESFKNIQLRLFSQFAIEDFKKSFE